MAVATFNYRSSVFTFFEQQSALADGVLIVADLGGAIDLTATATGSIVDMNAPEADRRLVELLSRPLPKDVTRRRARWAAQISKQFQAAEARFRPHWDRYKEEIASGDLEGAFRRLRRSLFIPLHYQYGDYMANADLLGAYANARRKHGGACPSLVKGRSPRLLTGSTLSGAGCARVEQPDAWIETARGVTYRATWEIGEATECFTSARQIYESAGDTWGVVLSLINLADVAWESGRISACCDMLQEALELLRRHPNGELRAIVHQDLLLRLTYATDFDAAARNKRAALRYGRSNNRRHSIVRANCARQSLLMCRYQRAQSGGVASFVPSRFATSARRHAELCASLSGRGTVQRNRVRASWLLGAASLALGRHDAARRELQTALERCHRIALVEFEGDILISLARCELESGNLFVAARLANEARHLASVTKRKLQECDALVILLAVAVRDADEPAVARVATVAHEAVDQTEPGGQGHMIARREIAALVGTAL